MRKSLEDVKHMDKIAEAEKEKQLLIEDILK